MKKYSQAEIQEVFSQLPKNRVGEADRRYVDEVLNIGFNNTDKTKMVARFEAAFAEKMGVEHAITFNSGTSTMQACLAAAGIGPGDEVIVPSLTMASTAFVALQCFAVPVFADIDPKTYTISVEDVKRKITPFTKAIIPVSIFGLPCDMGPIMELAKKHNLTVIEDNAQCFLGKYHGQLAGKLGHAASFSFQGSKHMTTSGEGGMVTTDDAEYAVKIRKACACGYAGLSSKPGSSSIPREIRQQPTYKRHDSMGYNYRMPILSAALGMGQLERLDAMVEARRIIAAEYDAVVGDCDYLIKPYVPEGYEHSYWCYTVRLDPEKTDIDFNTFRSKFIEMGGDGLYGCWSPVHLEPVFQKMNFFGPAWRGPSFHPLYQGNVKRYSEGDCPVFEKIQPTMLQFKTSATTYEVARGQAEALEKTLEWFEKRR